MIAKGTRVRFTRGPLGLVDEFTGGMEPETVDVGDEGTYEEPHPALDGWHYIEVEVTSDGGESRVLLCPCPDIYFEVVE